MILTQEEKDAIARVMDEYVKQANDHLSRYLFASGSPTYCEKCEGFFAGPCLTCYPVQGKQMDLFR